MSSENLLKTTIIKVDAKMELKLRDVVLIILLIIIILLVILYIGRIDEAGGAYYESIGVSLDEAEDETPEPIPTLCQEFECTSPPTISLETPPVEVFRLSGFPIQFIDYEPADMSCGFWSTSASDQSLPTAYDETCTRLTQPGAGISTSTGRIMNNDSNVPLGGYIIEYDGADLNDRGGFAAGRAHAMTQTEYEGGERLLYYGVRDAFDNDPEITFLTTVNVSSVSEWIEIPATLDVTGDTATVTWEPPCLTNETDFEIVVSVRDTTLICDDNNGNRDIDFTYQLGEVVTDIVNTSSVTVDLKANYGHDVGATVFLYPLCNKSVLVSENQIGAGGCAG